MHGSAPFEHAYFPRLSAAIEPVSHPRIFLLLVMLGAQSAFCIILLLSNMRSHEFKAQSYCRRLSFVFDRKLSNANQSLGIFFRFVQVIALFFIPFLSHTNLVGWPDVSLGLSRVYVRKKPL